MEFCAKCYLLDLNTGELEDRVISCIQDIRDIIGDGIKNNAKIVHIDKYHKVYYKKPTSYTDGVSCWIKIVSEYDKETNKWSKVYNSDFAFGDKLLLVECDDEKPIDISDSAKDFILSCIDK